MSEKQQPLIIDVFLTDKKPGSPQYLHFFSTQEKMLHSFNDYLVENEFDHSFIFVDKSHETHILWKNKDGPIQFCGSGAFAASAFLMKKYDLNQLKLTTPNLELKSYIENGKCRLEMPAKSCSMIKKMNTGDLYVNKETGIFLLLLKEKSLLTNNDWISQLKQELNKENIHGLCLFYWNENEDSGYLRYFVPWHGRDEDYVTGSIHQYLTSLIHQQTGKKNQHWVQGSSLPGELQTYYQNEIVTITGNVCIR